MTYGVSSAPFLAIRCLEQLASEHHDRFPIAASVVRRCFYVDDVLAGADSVPGAVELVRQLQEMLHFGCFELSKWAANEESLCDSIQVAESASPVSLGEDTTALGVLWYHRCDTLAVRVPPIPDGVPSKASILSFVALLFDPLGLWAPTSMRGKLLMQELWQIGQDWRAPVPDQTAIRFCDFCADLQALVPFFIPRWTGQQPGYASLLVGFADASERGSAACIYVRSVSGSDVVIRLLCAKTKVAPLKKVTIPKLKLAVCVMLVRLMSVVLRALQRDSREVVLFSDSTIALSWIAKPASSWRCFVANRVAQIHAKFPASSWRHVPVSDNPADLATRGVSARELMAADLWWSGPTFLRSIDVLISGFLPKFDEAALVERRLPVVALVSPVSTPHPWFSISNDFFRLIRVFARVVQACRFFRLRRGVGSHSPLLRGVVVFLMHH